jgi:hypothetical protein
MARLIDVDKIPYEECYVPDGDIQWGYKKALIAEKTVIDQMPTVDAVPVVHGRWLYDSGSGKHFCSACDEFALSFRKDRWAVGELYEVFLTDYCPHCGAKMDGDGNGT